MTPERMAENETALADGMDLLEVVDKIRKENEQLRRLVDHVSAEYVPDDEEDRRDGTDRFVCPVCRKAVMERNMEYYHEAGADKGVDICSECSEDFERDMEIHLDADILDTVVFKKLMDWVVQSVIETKDKA